jgi:hypothetical protein
MTATPGAAGMLWLWARVADDSRDPGPALCGGAPPRPRDHVSLYAALTPAGSALVDTPSE